MFARNLDTLAEFTGFETPLHEDLAQLQLCAGPLHASGVDAAIANVAKVAFFVAILAKCGRDNGDLPLVGHDERIHDAGIEGDLGLRHLVFVAHVNKDFSAETIPAVVAGNKLA